jgi:hypothetical protein
LCAESGLPARVDPSVPIELLAHRGAESVVLVVDRDHVGSAIRLSAIIECFVDGAGVSRGYTCAC